MLYGVIIVETCSALNGAVGEHFTILSSVNMTEAVLKIITNQLGEVMG
jgi:hypothetical protein